MSTRKIFIIPAALVTGVLLLGGCATVFDGRPDQVNVTSEPEGAVCTAKRSYSLAPDEVFPAVTTPGTLILSHSCGDVLVTCTKPGSGDGTGEIVASINPMFLPNILPTAYLMDVLARNACHYPDPSLHVVLPTRELAAQ